MSPLPWPPAGRLLSSITSRMERLATRWRYPTVTIDEPILARTGDRIYLSVGTRRRWRYGYELVLDLTAAEALELMVHEHLGDLIDEARGWRERTTGVEPPPRHVAGNAEDCPACALIPSNQIPYPWLCTGPAPEEADR